MSEETEQPEPQPEPVKPAKLAAPKKAPFNPFSKRNNNFTSSKAGNPGNKGKAFKGGGVKKGK